MDYSNMQKYGDKAAPKGKWRDGKKKKGFAIENVLFTMGWTILFCAVFLGVYMGLQLTVAYNGALRGGLLLGGLIILTGVYLASALLGIRKVILQNNRLLRYFSEL